MPGLIHTETMVTPEHFPKASYLDSSFVPPTQLFNHEGALIPHGACGGYSLPSFSTLGSQTHRLSSGTSAKTEGRWLPQPRHDVLAESCQW